MQAHLVYVSYVDVDVGGAEDAYAQGAIDGPQRLGSCLAVHVGRGGGDASRVRRHDKVVGRQLGVQAVLGHQHQVGHPAQHDATTDILTGERDRDKHTHTHRIEQIQHKKAIQLCFAYMLPTIPFFSFHYAREKNPSVPQQYQAPSLQKEKVASKSERCVEKRTSGAYIGKGESDKAFRMSLHLRRIHAGDLDKL